MRLRDFLSTIAVNTSPTFKRPLFKIPWCSKAPDFFNRKILSNTIVHTDVTDINSAKKKGAMALFGEKWRFDDYSYLCKGLS
jgi:hypothetical protein